jgi:hypothetical protein
LKAGRFADSSGEVIVVLLRSPQADIAPANPAIPDKHDLARPCITS